MTAGSRLIVLMLQCRKRVSSMVMQRYAPYTSRMPFGRTQAQRLGPVAAPLYG